MCYDLPEFLVVAVECDIDVLVGIVDDVETDFECSPIKNIYL